MIAGLYNETYKTLNQLYGESSDDDVVDSDGTIPPYRSNSTSEVRPYLQPTEHSETGFRGLEAPVG